MVIITEDINKYPLLEYPKKIGDVELYPYQLAEAEYMRKIEDGLCGFKESPTGEKYYCNINFGYLTDLPGTGKTKTLLALIMSDTTPKDKGIYVQEQLVACNIDNTCNAYISKSVNRIHIKSKVTLITSYDYVIENVWFTELSATGLKVMVISDQTKPENFSIEDNGDTRLLCEMMQEELEKYDVVLLDEAKFHKFFQIYPYLGFKRVIFDEFDSKSKIMVCNSIFTWFVTGTAEVSESKNTYMKYFKNILSNTSMDSFTQSISEEYLVKADSDFINKCIKLDDYEIFNLEKDAKSYVKYYNYYACLQNAHYDKRDSFRDNPTFVEPYISEDFKNIATECAISTTNLLNMINTQSSSLLEIIVHNITNNHVIQNIKGIDSNGLARNNYIRNFELNYLSSRVHYNLDSTLLTDMMLDITQIGSHNIVKNIAYEPQSLLLYYNSMIQDNIFKKYNINHLMLTYFINFYYLSTFNIETNTDDLSNTIYVSDIPNKPNSCYKHIIDPKMYSGTYLTIYSQEFTQHYNYIGYKSSHINKCFYCCKEISNYNITYSGMVFCNKCKDKVLIKADKQNKYYSLTLKLLKTVLKITTNNKIYFTMPYIKIYTKTKAEILDKLSKIKKYTKDTLYEDFNLDNIPDDTKFTVKDLRIMFNGEDDAGTPCVQNMTLLAFLKKCNGIVNIEESTTTTALKLNKDQSIQHIPKVNSFRSYIDDIQKIINENDGKYICLIEDYKAGSPLIIDSWKSKGYDIMMLNNKTFDEAKYIDPKKTILRYKMVQERVLAGLNFQFIDVIIVSSNVLDTFSEQKLVQTIGRMQRIGRTNKLKMYIL